MTPVQAIGTRERLLEAENQALRAGDVERAAWFAAEKEKAALCLTEAASEIAALRRGADPGWIDERLAVLGALLRDNERLVANAADAVRDLVSALEARDGRAGGYDARGTRTQPSKTGKMLNESI